MKVVLVVPDPRAAATGGNVYNLGLANALRDEGIDVRIVDRAASRGEGAHVVDSLYLEDVPRLAPCLLLAHYLPSLVDGGAPSPIERAALRAASGSVVPSAFMARELVRLEPRPAFVVAPGIEIGDVDEARAHRAALVANLVPGKGVLPFLRAIASRPIALDVIGSLEDDPEYASACRAAAGPGVAFLGARSHDATLRAIAAADFLVSSSRMESFGLVLAEARALGVPIVARPGGNAAAHVDANAGCALAESDDALAEECLRLAADRAELDRRRAAARARRPPARTWADAARDFVAALTGSSREG